MDRTALAALASDRALSAMTGQSPVKMWTETEIEALLSDLSEVA